MQNPIVMKKEYHVWLEGDRLQVVSGEDPGAQQLLVRAFAITANRCRDREGEVTIAAWSPLEAALEALNNRYFVRGLPEGVITGCNGTFNNSQGRFTFQPDSVPRQAVGDAVTAEPDAPVIAAAVDVSATTQSGTGFQATRLASYPHRPGEVKPGWGVCSFGRKGLPFPGGAVTASIGPAPG